MLETVPKNANAGQKMGTHAYEAKTTVKQNPQRIVKTLSGQREKKMKKTCGWTRRDYAQGRQDVHASVLSIEFI